MDFHVPPSDPSIKLTTPLALSPNASTPTHQMAAAPSFAPRNRRNPPDHVSAVDDTSLKLQHWELLSSQFTPPTPPIHDALNKFHPPRPDWYEEFYALVLSRAAESYEAEVARYKSQIFSNLRGKAQKILEIGIGTGPNLRYYASDSSDVEVIGIDPNQKMEKYARSSAASAGLPPSNFEFIHAVGEAIPLSDASVDAVVGTLVLCSVKDVDMTLKEMKRVLRPGGLYLFVEHVGAKEGSILRFLQRILDPLQQTLADGCHLTRDTGNIISTAGFSSVELNMAFLSKATFVNPHVYGIAYK
ncbi:methyltransferase-like protein 7A [Senna tora]|uniref:Methyltransferase-like protein 7A n=1 Tax=Senna tora TaxID=362788 RepID=A0A834W4A8_9FABA|nr:methyltransferase-like protein 7A [Senna tora]